MPEDAETSASESDQDALLRLLVESVKDYAIFILGTDGRVRTWNEGARRIKGYEASEIIGRHFSVFYPANEARRGKTDYELAVAAEEGRWEEDGWRIRKDGSRFWASVVITALHDPQGELVGFAKVTRDLTERKQAEEQRDLLLRLEREARTEAEGALTEVQSIQGLTEAALAHLTVANLLDELLLRVCDILEVDTAVVLLIDHEKNTLLPVAARGLEGVVSSETLMSSGGAIAWRIASDRQPIIVDDMSQIKGEDAVLYEHGIKSLLGVPLLIESRLIGVLHVGVLHQRHFLEREAQLLQMVGDRVAMAIDRARLIEAEHNARIDVELAEARLRAQDAFLATAAHELRSPAASVKAAVQLLMRRIATHLGGDQQEWLPFLELADQQVDRLTRLVDNLIESVRAGANYPGLDIAYTNTAALVRQAVALSQAHAAEYKFNINVPDELWAWIDPLRFEEVVINLVDNAVKYSNSQRIDIDLDRSDDGMLRLAVRDHGTGISAEQAPKLFERFYRGAGSQGSQGMGLGLFICREIVEQHGGTIVAEHPAGGGARFVVALPMRQNPEHELHVS